MTLHPHPLLLHREFEVEGGAALRAGFSPEPALVGTDDRPANGKAQTQPVGFGGNEGLEEAFDIRRETATLVPQRRANPALVRERLNAKPAVARRVVGHGVRRVEDEIQDKLLKLHPISRNQRQIGSESQRTVTPRPIRSARLRTNTSSITRLSCSG